MIIGFIGNMGSGKTLSMVRRAYQKFRKGYTIYSNIELNFPHNSYTIDDIIAYADSGKRFYKSIWLLDEAHIFMDSRNSASKKSKLLSYWILQTRKADIELLFTTQNFFQIDIRLRNMCDDIVECYKKAYKDEFIILNRHNIIRMEGIMNHIIYFKAKPIYPLYDTLEIVRNIMVTEKK